MISINKLIVVLLFVRNNTNTKDDCVKKMFWYLVIQITGFLIWTNYFLVVKWQKAMCPEWSAMVHEFLRTHHSHICAYRILYRYYNCNDNIVIIIICITCQNWNDLYYINMNLWLTGHYSSMLCKCTVLGQNCNASQTFTACATLRRYESATASHKDRSHCICCNGQSRSSTNEWKECSGSKGE